MQVVRFYIPNSLENYNHLLICEDSAQAAVVDPFNAEAVQTQLEQAGVKLTKILLTHGHGDHVSGVSGLLKLYDIPVYGDAQLKQVTQPVVNGDTIRIGNSEVQVLDTPGHFFPHQCFWCSQEKPFLITGDTLFNGGVGNTKVGNTKVLYQSIQKLKDKISPQTDIYPSHDYLCTNLRFTDSILPINPASQRLLEEQECLNPDQRKVTQFEDELSFNLFLKTESEEVMEAIKNKTGQKPVSSMDCFIALRKLRDQW